MLFAASVFGGSRLAASIRVLMIASGVLALAGLSGVVAGDMHLRNVGIVGYLGVFLVVAGLLAVLFYRAKPFDGQITNQSLIGMETLTEQHRNTSWRNRGNDLSP
jgi:hypothetical protein